MRQFLLFVMLFLHSLSNAYAWNIQDLWATRDQQGARAMQNKEYQRAQQLFKQPAWLATAAYRAQDYQTADRIFGQLNTADGYYNQGNALAHLGQYQEALSAYQKSLKLRPNDADTLHNKKLIEDLLKQPQEENKQDQSKEQNQKKEQDQSSKEHNPKEDKQDPSTKKQNQEKTQKQEPEKEPDQEESKQESSSKEPDASEKEEPETKSSSSSAENYQTNEQWLNMIPDDPGGLLRQKFLRDHRRRSNGEKYE